jgi:hypothetical protein
MRSGQAKLAGHVLNVPAREGTFKTYPTVRWLLLAVSMLMVGCGAIGGGGGYNDLEKQSPSYWIEHLRDTDEAVQRRCAQLLQTKGAEDKAIRALLMQTLQSSQDIDLQEKLCRIIGEIGWSADDLYDDLYKHMRAHSEEIRLKMAISRAMNKINDKKAAGDGVPYDINKPKD